MTAGISSLRDPLRGETGRKYDCVLDRENLSRSRPDFRDFSESAIDLEKSQKSIPL